MREVKTLDCGFLSVLPVIKKQMLMYFTYWHSLLKDNSPLGRIKAYKFCILSKALHLFVRYAGKIKYRWQDRKIYSKFYIFFPCDFILNCRICRSVATCRVQYQTLEIYLKTFLILLMLAAAQKLYVHRKFSFNSRNKHLMIAMQMSTLSSVC